MREPGIALLFSGQGAQHPAMLPWLEEAGDASRRLAALLGADWRAKLEDEAWRRDNTNAQVVVTAASLAALEALRGGLPAVVAVAGYSVGELAAYAAAGLFDDAAALALARRRAAAMSEAAAAAPGGMLAVSGLAVARTLALCAPRGFELAIRIAPQRCVIGGPEAHVEQVASDCAAAGGHASRLCISVASHTPYLRAAVGAFRSAAMAGPAWQKPSVPVVTGVRGAVVRDVATLREDLVRQIATPIRWDEVLQTVAERRPACVLQMGPGDALARWWREAVPEIPSRSTDEFDSLASLLAWIGSPA